MAELTLPASIANVEQVKAVRTPAHLDYSYTPGSAMSRFLLGLKDKKILGQRCPKCSKVYVPPRGACPTDGVPTEEEVELPHTGTVTTFCVVNVQFYGQGMEIPYVSALVLLDGADLPLMHLVQEIPYDQVHMGMRVEAVWVPDDELKPTLESIKWFKPNGEPDADPSTYREERLMRDVAVVSFAQTKHVRSETDHNEVEMVMPIVREVLDDAGIGMDRVGFTCSGSSDYLAGQAFSFVMTLDAVGPWPPISESHVEMDGAWALYEAWVKLQMGEVDIALVYAYGKSSPGGRATC